MVFFLQSNAWIILSYLWRVFEALKLGVQVYFFISVEFMFSLFYTVLKTTIVCQGSEQGSTLLLTEFVYLLHRDRWLLIYHGYIGSIGIIMIWVALTMQ